MNPNGMVTFDLPYASHRNALATHFESPRVVGLFADLAPEEQGQVSYEIIQGGDARAVVTFEQVPEFGRANSESSFQHLGSKARRKIDLLELLSELLWIVSEARFASGWPSTSMARFDSAGHK